MISEDVEPSAAAAEERAPAPIILDFEGPPGDGDPATFYDRRLTAGLVHTASGARAQALGYFAADGAASESGASAGAVWRVRFAPPAPGLWRYTLSFRSAPNIASQPEPELGGAVKPLHGHSGEILATLSAEPDRRAVLSDRIFGGGVEALGRLGVGGAAETGPSDARVLAAKLASAALAVGAGWVRLDAFAAGALGPWRAPPSADPSARGPAFALDRLELWGVFLRALDARGVGAEVRLDPPEPAGFWTAPDLMATRRVLLREMIARFGAGPRLRWRADAATAEQAFAATLEPALIGAAWRPSDAATQARRDGVGDDESGRGAADASPRGSEAEPREDPPAAAKPKTLGQSRARHGGAEGEIGPEESAAPLDPERADPTDDELLAPAAPERELERELEPELEPEAETAPPRTAETAAGAGRLGAASLERLIRAAAAAPQAARATPASEDGGPTNEASGRALGAGSAEIPPLAPPPEAVRITEGQLRRSVGPGALDLALYRLDAGATDDATRLGTRGGLALRPFLDAKASLIARLSGADAERVWEMRLWLRQVSPGALSPPEAESDPGLAPGLAPRSERFEDGVAVFHDLSAAAQAAAAAPAQLVLEALGPPARPLDDPAARMLRRWAEPVWVERALQETLDAAFPARIEAALGAPVQERVEPAANGAAGAAANGPAMGAEAGGAASPPRVIGADEPEDRRKKTRPRFGGVVSAARRRASEGAAAPRQSAAAPTTSPPSASPRAPASPEAPVSPPREGRSAAEGAAAQSAAPPPSAGAGSSGRRTLGDAHRGPLADAIARSKAAAAPVASASAAQTASPDAASRATVSAAFAAADPDAPPTDGLDVAGLVAAHGSNAAASGAAGTGAPAAPSLAAARSAAPPAAAAQNLGPPASEASNPPADAEPEPQDALALLRLEVIDAETDRRVEALRDGAALAAESMVGRRVTVKATLVGAAVETIDRLRLTLEGETLAQRAVDRPQETADGSRLGFFYGLTFRQGDAALLLEAYGASSDRSAAAPPLFAERRRFRID